MVGGSAHKRLRCHRILAVTLIISETAKCIWLCTVVGPAR